MTREHLHRVQVLVEEVSYWEPNRLVSNTMMEGLIFQEMLKHPHVIRAKELGEIEVVDDNSPYSQKTVYIIAYFDDDAMNKWEKYMFLEKLNGKI